ncbi:AfsR/SARP family transcriptional regulator [Streptomyces sp. NPDC047065]|uniref:AfsR/SARP family transcriptional regulator n=1 Tax=Streptomyces sp. NPDC047065 TaxID=3154606 RepID=UPI0033F84412
MQPETTNETFTFKILGPLEFRAAGVEFGIAGVRQQTLLTLLLLEAGRTITSPRLIEGVWGGRPPETAEAQLRICVSRLRRRLADAGLRDVISTESNGYRLNVPEDRIDVHRCAAHLERSAQAETAGDIAEAVRQLRSALALWRGPAAEGLPSPVVRAAAARLDEERASALEHCFGMEIQQGRHHHIVPELMSIATEHPFREGLQSHLMTALYHSGRQADALRVYREVKRRFTEELGIDPSERLRTLEAKILEQNPRLDEDGPALPKESLNRLAALERENASLRAERQHIGRLMVRFIHRSPGRVPS